MMSDQMRAISDKYIGVYGLFNFVIVIRPKLKEAMSVLKSFSQKKTLKYLF